MNKTIKIGLALLSSGIAATAITTVNTSQRSLDSKGKDPSWNNSNNLDTDDK